LTRITIGTIPSCPSLTLTVSQLAPQRPTTYVRARPRKGREAVEPEPLRVDIIPWLVIVTSALLQLEARVPPQYPLTASRYHAVLSTQSTCRTGARRSDTSQLMYCGWELHIRLTTRMGRPRPARSKPYQAGRGSVAPAPAGDMPTPLRILHAPSVCSEGQGSSQSAPAGHRPTGPRQSRHPPRVHSPGRRYPSLRVIGPVVAAEHMSDGRTRTRRPSPGQPRCALRARLSDEPGSRGTNGPRDWRLAPRAESDLESLHWRNTAQGRPVYLWPARVAGTEGAEPAA
jgi:hypothetical protein